jgi:hypothetical protein
LAFFMQDSCVKLACKQMDGIKKELSAGRSVSFLLIGSLSGCQNFWIRTK